MSQVKRLFDLDYLDEHTLVESLESATTRIVFNGASFTNMNPAVRGSAPLPDAVGSGGLKL